MTSTSINIGFAETKNSSRVLKPPGGGHSDIFGIRGENEGQNPLKKKHHPQTTISSCFVHEEVDKPNGTDKESNKDDIENGNQNGKTEITDENTEPTKDINIHQEKEEESENKNAAPQRRVRVPPGGFSSGLW